MNDAPTLDALSNIVLPQNGAVRVVTLTGIGTGATTEAQPLILTAGSSDPAIVLNPVVSYTSGSTTGLLAVAAVPGASGAATITVRLSDAQSSNSIITRTFTATINAAPVIAALPNLVVNEDTSSPVITVTVSDPDDAAATLSANVASSNTALLPAGGISFTGGNGNYSLRVTPAANQSGFSTLTITASDTNGNVTTQELLVTVVSINDAPTLGALADLTLVMGTLPRTINLVGISTGAANENQTLTLTAFSDNLTVLPHPNVSYTSPAATGSLVIRPSTNNTGIATVTVTVTDDGDVSGGGVNAIVRTFRVSVVSSPPLSITKASGNITVSWPTSAGPGWNLQSSTDPTNSAGWTAAGGTVVEADGRYSVTLPASSQALFFRVRQP
jgi:hypothetical protein